MSPPQNFLDTQAQPKSGQATNFQCLLISRPHISEKLRDTT